MKLRVDMRSENAVAITDDQHTVWRVRLCDIRAIAQRDDDSHGGLVVIAGGAEFMVNADELIALTEKWLAWVERQESVPA